MEELGSFLLESYRTGFQKRLADLRHAAALARRDFLQLFFEVHRYSKCELRVLLHESRAYQSLHDECALRRGALTRTICNARLCTAV
jgi:hypothetical protein